MRKESNNIYLPKNPTKAKLPWLWLGTWSIGGYSWGKTDIKESTSIIETALERGITHIDTAGFYSQGLSEKIIASQIKRDRENIFISTKAGLVLEGKEFFHKMDPATLRVTLFQTLDKLSTDYIDLYLLQGYLHPNLKECIDTVKALKEEGLIRYWGVCNLNEEQIHSYIEDGANIVHQTKFNPLHRSDSILKAGKQNNKCYNCIYSPLEQGMITSDFNFSRLEEFHDTDIRKNNAYFKNNKILNWITTLQNTSKDLGISLTQANIAWIYSKPYVDAIVVGTRKLSQLDQFIDVATNLKIEYSQIFPLLEEGLSL